VTLGELGRTVETDTGGGVVAVVKGIIGTGQPGHQVRLGITGSGGIAVRTALEVVPQGIEGKPVADTPQVFRLGLEPRFNLSYGPLRELENPTLELVRSRIISTRESKLPDPERIGSAGSFFMNPVVPRSQYEALAADYPDMPHYPAADGMVKLSAGWMIDQCGFKGFSRGRAGVYERQALVLVNRGGASAGEIISLSEEIISAVSEKFGVTLRPEVQIVK
jgi:UDP-N-acetylmuramate dehydrogenase